MGTKVAVLGAGSWGTALASIVARKAPAVLWSRSGALAEEIREKHTNSAYLGDRHLPTTLHATDDLAETIGGATTIVLAVPSKGLREVLERVRDIPDPWIPVVSVTKGIEAGSLCTMTEIIRDCWGERHVAVLTGPNLAEEVLAGQPSASVVACSDERSATELQDLFSTDSWRIYTNSDVVGCEIAGAAKNVLAIASGMAVGLGMGANTQAALVTRSLAELARLGVAMGGDPLTFSGLAGLGDLVATCNSPMSRNRQVGIELAKGRSVTEIMDSMRMVAEGVSSALPVVALASRHAVEMPVAEQVVAVCFEGRKPAETIPHLMRRAARSETDDQSSRRK